MSTFAQVCDSLEEESKFERPIRHASHAACLELACTIARHTMGLWPNPGLHMATFAARDFVCVIH